MIYTVGEAAKMLGVAPSALRYYDKEGLLPFVERSGGGMRMFKDSDIEWLKLIDCLKATGMPIKGIKQFIECTLRGDESIGERLEILSAPARPRRALETLRARCGAASVQAVVQPAGENGDALVRALARAFHRRAPR